jgi:hypothetical protein
LPDQKKMTDIQKLFSFSQQIAGKRVVIFGAGRSASQFLAELPVAPEFFGDNDPRREGEVFLGRPVRAVQALMDVPREALFVVICTQDFEAAALQLSTLGLVPDTHFIEAPQFQILEQHAGDLLVSCIGDHGGIYRVNALTKQSESVFQGDVRGLSVGQDSIVAVLEHEGLVRLGFDFKVVQRGGRKTGNRKANLLRGRRLVRPERWSYKESPSVGPAVRLSSLSFQGITTVPWTEHWLWLRRLRRRGLSVLSCRPIGRTR